MFKTHVGQYKFTPEKQFLIKKKVLHTLGITADPHTSIIPEKDIYKAGTAHSSAQNPQSLVIIPLPLTAITLQT